ncbi:hypothetical protein Q4534_08315 [Cyclobacterium sp. 1_MG-2023]|uniref:hypothetical protein n=1 Tax=Cyclobacterium sp. 1_MG-2023 TaxID=3062681 RepID=UPI0026E14412|nr:hypothetical protein [Cyclobacterium sp. 1_MG-2023]MDO6437405.1 hypothetical protein [Cyclobacterium sp. 1_MG-2023]
MRKALKGSSFLFYFLTILVFFVLGGLFSRYMGVGKNQGLAGGAIVLGYALTYAFGALIVAIILAGKLKTKIIVYTNFILFIVLTIFIFLGYKRHLEMEKNKVPAQERLISPKPTAPAQPIHNIQFENGMGQGFFSPNFVENDKLYFYSPTDPRAWNGVGEAIDSLVFYKNRNGQYDIQYAPPYFFPEIVKMDYEWLMIKVITSGKYMLELEINQETGQSVLVDKFSGNLIYWPEFILNTNSVEIMEAFPQKVLIKPLENAAVNSISYVFLQPIAVQGDWLKVNLTDKEFFNLGQGWIKWKSNDKLIIRYNLFS